MVHAQALQIDGLACKKAPGVAPGLKSLGRLIAVFIKSARTENHTSLPIGTCLMLAGTLTYSN